MAQHYNAGTLLSRLGTGVLNGYLVNRDRELRQQDVTSERAYADQRTAQNQDFQRGLQQDAYAHQDTVYDKTNTDAEAKRRRDFLENLVTASASQGVLTPELSAELQKELGADLSPSAAALLNSISAGAASDKKAKAALERDKLGAKDSSKPADLSQLKGDLTAGLGFEPAPEVIQGVAALVQTGVAPIAAVRQLYPGNTEIPKATQPSGEKLKDVAGIMRNLETAHADQVKASAALGLSLVDVAERVAGGEEPTDAFRHTEADKYVEQIVGTLGIPKEQVIDMKAINQTLTSNGLHPITGSDTRTLTDLVDEMVRHNIGGGGKKPKVETIMAIIQVALAPPAQPRAQANIPGLESLTRGAIRFGQALTPGRSQQRTAGVGGGPAFQNRSVQGQRNP